MEDRLAQQGAAKTKTNATANRAFDLCNILYKLTVAENNFNHTNKVTAPPIVKAVRKWRRMTLKAKLPREVNFPTLNFFLKIFLDGSKTRE